MDRMVREADAIVVICPKRRGHPSELLGNLTPVEYEICRFRDKLRKEYSGLDGRFFLFKSSHLGESDLDALLGDLGVDVVPFSGPAALAGLLFPVGRRLSTVKPERPAAVVQPPMIVRYSGPDFRGLLDHLSRNLYRSDNLHREWSDALNVTYISFASGGGVATLYISCEPWISAQSSLSPKKLGSLLEKNLRREIKAAQQDGRLARHLKVPRTLISVSQGEAAPRRVQFFIEARTIDRPGQIYAISHILNEQRYNTDELQLRPAERDYPEQTMVILWVSKAAEEGNRDLEGRDLVVLETAIRETVGVRALSIRAVGVT
jgi:hypothetical protein